jgi:hypothetical protein
MNWRIVLGAERLWNIALTTLLALSNPQVLSRIAADKACQIPSLAVYAVQSGDSRLAHLHLFYVQIPRTYDASEWGLQPCITLRTNSVNRWFTLALVDLEQGLSVRSYRQFIFGALRAIIGDSTHVQLTN